MYGTGPNSTVRICRVCRCTENISCEPDSCFWVSLDLCSECVRKNPAVATPWELTEYKRLEGLI